MLAKTNNASSESTAFLEQIFERFNESSRKLEARHSALMTEVEELRGKLEQKEEEIKRSERLAVLGETAAALAHEVRNPLGAITLFISMLRDDVTDRPQATMLVDEIEKSIASLNHVVSNVLHFAKNNKLDVAPINVHSIIAETAQHFSSLYAPGAEFITELSGNPFVLGDDQALRQGLYNIVMNALQATNFNVRFTLSCEDLPESEGVVITLKDNGPGIPEELLSRLFEPFVCGRREGTGLGLSIVRRIVEAHGGTIVARNDNGAEFSIILPRKAESNKSK